MTAPGDDRWEMGSLFHAAEIPPETEGGGSPPPWHARPHALVGSGRDALRLLLEARSPERVWVPSYLCQEVVGAVGACSDEVLVYPDGPLDPGTGDQVPDLRAGDAVLTVAYFGVRCPIRPGAGEGPGRVAREDVLVIEDHTHGPCGPWARGSEADFCVASLRKLWPLPDGGVLWSPAERPVPDAPPVLPELERASGIKTAGMELKSRYLGGEAVSKPLFRELLDRGERSLHGADTSGMTAWSGALLEALPFDALEEARRRRFERLTGRLPQLEGYRVLLPPPASDDEPAPTPFSAFFVFDDVDARDRVHRALVEERVYASRLWPLDRPVLSGVRDRDVELSRRSFSFPVDMRYTSDDMDRAAAILEEALGRVL